MIAARLAEEERPDLDIHVLDSRAVAGSQGFVALEAHRASREGLSLPATVARIEKLVPRLHLLAYLDTLKYLGRSGKITKAKAWAGTLLGFKPLVELSQGEATLIARPRSSPKAMERLLSIVSERTAGSPSHVNIMHANALEKAHLLREEALRSMNCREIFISEFTPVMGAHTGPGLLGIAYYTDSYSHSLTTRGLRMHNEFRLSGRHAGQSVEWGEGADTASGKPPPNPLSLPP